MPKQQQGFKGKFFVPGVRNSRCPPPEKPTNKPVSLGDKSDEEIIQSTIYDFSVDIKTLLNNSKNTRRCRANPGKPPRPQNAFMLYRRDKSAKHKQENKGKKIKQCNFSVEISDMWKNESLEVKELFRALARVSEKIHMETHGEDYRYLPRQRRQNYRRKNNEDGSSHSYSDTDIGSPSSTSIPDSPASDSSDMSNFSPDFYNTDDTIASSVSDFSDFPDFSGFGNNNLNNSSGYANFNTINVIPPVTPVTSVVPVTSVPPIPKLELEDQEFRQIFFVACNMLDDLAYNLLDDQVRFRLAYSLYMDGKSKNSTSGNTSQDEVVSNTLPEFSEDFNDNEFFDYSSFLNQ